MPSTVQQVFGCAPMWCWHLTCRCWHLTVHATGGGYRMLLPIFKQPPLLQPQLLRLQDPNPPDRRRPPVNRSHLFIPPAPPRRTALAKQTTTLYHGASTRKRAAPDRLLPGGCPVGL
eukprot:8516761-Alexandrium_andersonii.AAC.1